MSIIKFGLSELPNTLTDFGVSRLLVVSGPSRRFVDRLARTLHPTTFDVFDGAVRHVPEAVVEAASRRVEELRVDAVVAVGGGSAVGLGKALRLRHELRFIAVPTTYSGSERTNLYGTTRTVEGVSTKQTGRDERARADVIVYAPELFLEMPVTLTVTSLLNAAAHAFGGLSQEGVDDASVQRATSAFVTLFACIEALVRAPEDREARRHALGGAGEAAALLEGGSVSPHHRLAHRIGGAFDVDHSGLHSVLLPYSLHEYRHREPARMQELERRIGVWDLEGHLFDLLKRARAKTSLSALGVPPEGLTLAAEQLAIPKESAFWLSPLGRRPSRAVNHETIGTRLPVAVYGVLPSDAKVVVVALHGRDSTAEVALAFVRDCLGGLSGLCIVAPQAPAGEWYEGGYAQSNRGRTQQLESSLGDVGTTLTWVKERAPGARLCLFGFSQGACLALEVLAETSVRLDAVAALSGARVVRETGIQSLQMPTSRCPLLLGVSAQDAWVNAVDVESAARDFGAAGHEVVLEQLSGATHALHLRHRLSVRRVLSGREMTTLEGFGAPLQSEALPGALPLHQNSPRHAPYGLYPEQLSGTAFGLPRHKNLRTWLYRIRPSAQQSPFRPLRHETFTTAFTSEPVEPNLFGWRPCPIPSAGQDFVDGIVTLGGAGDGHSRRGYALHWFTANRSMDNRAFCNADGDFLLVPQLGELTLVTELGVLEVGTGQIALLPRGLRYSVVLRSPAARGFIAEVYGRHFELPERGVIGANGLADARHFRTSTAWFEDRLELGYRITSKLGGVLYDAQQDYSPYDVVAWHGNYVPYVYDLAAFVPVSNVRVDHPDPSIYSVVSCPLDETGSNLLDLIVFPPRWDPTEHTFRPPFFHRNATMEWNAVVRSDSSDGALFESGVSFLTPPMTPHGVTSAAVERAFRLDEATAAVPHRSSDQSLWIQFESSLPLQLSPLAREPSRAILDWPTVWGAYRNHFRPQREWNGG
jgi:homogentisate 1,2-dioxygenase